MEQLFAVADTDEEGEGESVGHPSFPHVPAAVTHTVTSPLYSHRRYWRECRKRLAELEIGITTLSRDPTGSCLGFLCLKRHPTQTVTLDTAPADAESQPSTTPASQIHQPDTTQATTRTKRSLAGIRPKAGLPVASEGQSSLCPQPQSHI